MKENSSFQNCLNCSRPETVVPLVNLSYAGHQAWICTQCLPILIHNPQKLAGRLPGAENMAPAPAVDDPGSK